MPPHSTARWKGALAADLGHGELAALQLPLDKIDQRRVAADFSAQDDQPWIQDQRQVHKNVRNDLRALAHDLDGARIALLRQVQNLDRIDLRSLRRLAACLSRQLFTMPGLVTTDSSSPNSWMVGWRRDVEGRRR